MSMISLFPMGTLASMNWTFAEIIERISMRVDLYPGDVIGSGTVGTGCFLESEWYRQASEPRLQRTMVATQAIAFVRKPLASECLENKYD